MSILLLDRDGTIIKEPHDRRVDSLEKVEFFPELERACALLLEYNIDIVLITNQSGIAEGRISESEFHDINNYVVDYLTKQGVRVLATYMCPHQDSDNCTCRKPEPELILRVLSDYDINPHDTYYIGDRDSDVLAGMRASVKTILVETSSIARTERVIEYTARNILDAVEYVIKQNKAI